MHSIVLLAENVKNNNMKMTAIRIMIFLSKHIIVMATSLLRICKGLKQISPKIDLQPF